MDQSMTQQNQEDDSNSIQLNIKTTDKETATAQQMSRFKINATKS